MSPGKAVARLEAAVPASTPPRAARGRERRVPVNLPPAVVEAMRVLAEAHGISCVDEISRACALWKYCWEQHSAGGAVLIRSGASGEVSQVLLDVMVAP